MEEEAYYLKNNILIQTEGQNRKFLTGRNRKFLIWTNMILQSHHASCICFEHHSPAYICFECDERPVSCVTLNLSTTI